MNVRVAFIKELELPDAEVDILIHLPKSGPESDPAYPLRFRALARQTRCNIVSAPYLTDNSVEMAWISPEGETLQRSCFPDTGLQAGDDVTVFNTVFGKVAMCCDADIFQPQYARLAALRGCRLLLAATARIRIGSGLPDPGDLLRGGDGALFLAAPWASAQANGIAVAFAGMGGGRLILPCAATEDNSGLGKEEVNWDDLAKAANEFPVFGCMNPQLYKRYRKELGA